ncbi:MAG: flavodoxin family protein [Planctomycetota bacterium]|jgi:multimeric flavodoxin WrbA
MKPNTGYLYVILIAVGLSTIPAVTGFPSQAAAQERKVSVPPSELPAVIRKAIEKAFPKGQILIIEKEIEGEDPGQYDMEIRSRAKVYEVEISPQGEVIEVKERTSDEKDSDSEQGKKWTEYFGQENCTFSSTGRNRFFILEPAHQLVLESRQEKVVITILNETKKIGNVVTRVVEEREEENGKLKEVSRNFFAICREHGDVFYFGEEVDDYEDGKIVRHSGAWRADEKDSKAGIIMPGTILLGARHYQEIAPNAMDRAEIISDDVTMKTPAGTFENCIIIEETSGLDPDEKYYKTYAPGVGLIQDEYLLLTRHSKPKEANISLKDLPRAVHVTRKKLAAGRKITEIEKETADVLIAYDSLTGNTERMAQAVVKGVKQVPGAVAVAKRIREVTREDLEAADAIVLGCPTYYANIPGRMKTLIEDWSWRMKVDFTDKVGGAFATGGGQMGGKEHVVISLLLFMINNRMIVAGPLYQDEEGQDIWAETGAGAMTGPIDPGIGRKELDSASRLGERVARLALKLEE